MERKIASKDTIMVRKVNGNGSNGVIPTTTPAFATIHAQKNMAWKAIHAPLPKKCVTESANVSIVDRASRASRSKLFMTCLRRRMCSELVTVGSELFDFLFVSWSI